MEFHAERNAELQKVFIAAWEAAVARDGLPTAQEVSELATQMPASRFYVSEERAYNVVSQMLRGLPVLEGMRGPKRRMFKEIERRVREKRMAQPSATLTELISKVVYEPAPEFYLQPSTLKFLLGRAKQERRRHGRRP